MRPPTPAGACPFHPERDERKSASLAARHVKPQSGSEVIRSFRLAREILRHEQVRQDGAGAEYIDLHNPEHVPVFFLDGEVHNRRRNAIKKYFTPAAVKERHRPVMEQTTDDLLARLRRDGTARLDEITFELASTVVSGIIGLTHGDRGELAQRLSTLLTATFNNDRGVRKLFNKGRLLLYGFQFLVKDVRPAVRERKKRRRDDVISQTLDKGYSEKAIVIECLTYATAGMITTREFIVMAAWYMFERPELRARYLAAAEEEQLRILQEILRLEPIAAMIFRRTSADIETESVGAIPASRRYSIDLRAVNTDESVVGACPYAIDPDRGGRQNDNGTFMSFGDGAHRCPGWQVALHETRVFIDRLLRVPGIRLVREPDMLWNATVNGYELRNAIVACDRA
jgi:cytochrome P450